MALFLNLSTEYALRAMAHLALMKNNAAVPAQDLSHETGIPVHYLSKIMRHLVNAGLVESQKGHGGGFQLALHPRKINFSDVLNALDAMPGANDCVFGWGRCNPKAPCPLHHLWEPMGERFLHWAEGTTLDKVKPYPEISRVRRQKKHPKKRRAG